VAGEEAASSAVSAGGGCGDGSAARETMHFGVGMMELFFVKCGVCLSVFLWLVWYSLLYEDCLWL
jgi:hypothetical protein